MATATPTTATKREPLPYRTAFETKLDFAGAAAVVKDELRRWLRSKRYDLDAFDAGLLTIGKGVVLRYAATNNSTGWQLREQNQGATWTTTVSVTHDGRHPRDEWVSISVEPSAPPGVAVPNAHTPRFVGPVLDAVQAYDGDADLRGRPVLISESFVQSLLDIVCAEGRRLPTVVAAAPTDVPFEQWRQATDRIMGPLAGLASMYMLDPNAVVAFNEGIGPTHRIGPGAIRTYLPGVDPAVEEDGLRHKVLSRRSIESLGNRAIAILVSLPQRLAAAAMPGGSGAAVAVSTSDFARAAIRLQPDTHAVPGVDDDLASLRDEVRQYDALLTEMDDKHRILQSELDRRVDEIMDLAGDLEATQAELDKAQATVRALRQRLSAAGRHQDAYAPVDQPAAPPMTFADLLDRLAGQVSVVVYTGDLDETLGLDEYPQNATWARTAWNAVLALRDYAERKSESGYSGDFRTWCESPPDGGIVLPAGKVARDESGMVRSNPRWAGARVFPVPTTVDSSGQIFMAAHIKLGSTAQIAPRLYFHDAVDADGRIYIGYIGPHLPNRLTT